jgi:heme/copper-type cytochrome/quinol oxidase subunit 2
MTTDADVGEQAQRQAERKALKNVRGALDGIAAEDARKRRVFRRTAAICAVIVVVVIGLLAAFIIDARSRRIAAESPIQLKLRP